LCNDIFKLTPRKITSGKSAAVIKRIYMELTPFLNRSIGIMFSPLYQGAVVVAVLEGTWTPSHHIAA
jgi:hypothetical protein